MPTPAEVYQQSAQQEQRDELIVQHLEFVRHVVGKIAISLPPTCDRDDLESAGIVGLIEAAQQYDSERGVPFTSFAFPRIRGAIYDELRRNSPVPQAKSRQIAKVREACERATPPVTPENIARETGLTIDQVWECLELMRLLQPEPWRDLESAVLASSPHRHDEASQAMEREEALSLLADAIEQLPERERIVITLYYLEDLRLKEIGLLLNVTESRVSRLVGRAQFHLKELVRARYAP